MRLTAFAPAEWDALVGARGAMAWEALHLLERSFGQGERAEDAWGFHYYVVADGAGRPLLATFFTCALWKDDMLADARVSERLERARAADPYLLTSKVFAMGCLLTEGDHLYLDRNADWKGALDVLAVAVAEDAKAAGAGTIVLRDLHAADIELAEAVRERGYVKTSLPASLVYEPVDGGDDEWLARLTPKARVHQRKSVLPFDAAYDVEWLGAGGLRSSVVSRVERPSSLRSCSSISSSNATSSTRPACLARAAMNGPSLEAARTRANDRLRPAARPSVS